MTLPPFGLPIWNELYGRGGRKFALQLRVLDKSSLNRTARRRGSRRGSFRFEMLCTKMALHAASPAAHKRKVQRSADRRAGKRNQSPGPLFRRLSANLRGETFRDARGKFFENLFFSEILAVIDAGSSRGRLPHFNPLVAATSFKSIEQRKALDEPQRDHREQAGIRQKRDHATEAESRAFRKGQPLSIANQRLGDGVQALGGNVFHPRKIRNPQAVLAGKVTPEFFGVNLDRTESAEYTKPQKASERTYRQRPFDRVVCLCHAYKHPNRLLKN